MESQTPYGTEREPGTAPAPTPYTTPKQRFVQRMINTYANDLERGERREQKTAALLHLVADAIERGYEAELVALARGWRLERERDTENPGA